MKPTTRALTVGLVLAVLVAGGLFSVRRASAAEPDVLIAFPIENIDPAIVRDAVQRFDGPGPLHDDLRAFSTTYAGVFVPGALRPVPAFEGGDISVSSTGTFPRVTTTVTIRLPGEVTTQKTSETVAALLSQLAGWAVGISVAAICSFTVPVAVAWCGTLAGFIGGFTAGILDKYFKGEDLGKLDAWGAILVNALFGALGGAVAGTTATWTSMTGREVFYKAWDIVKGAWRVFTPFLGGVPAGLDAFFGGLGNIGSWLPSGLAAAGVKVTSPHPLRILPFGDSITHGYASSSDNGYRGPLQQGLADLGATTQFVGSQRSSGDRSPQPDHEGHDGWTTQQLAEIASRTMFAYQPNLVLLDVGTNDYTLNKDPGGAVGRAQALVDLALGAAPGTTVLVASLIPVSDAGAAAGMRDFNDKMSAWVGQRAGQGRSVRWVDMGAVRPWELGDGVHPTDAGYHKMAVAWALAITAAAGDGLIKPANEAHGPLTPAACASRDGWLPRGKVAGGMPYRNAGGRVRFADIDGDKVDDYVLLDAQGGALAWLNRGMDTDNTKGWVYRGEIASGTGAPPERIRFADLDGDGKDDYVVIRDGGALDVYLNRGGDTADAGGMRPGFEARTDFARGTGDDWRSIRFGDIDGDGKDDYLVVRNNVVDVWRNAGGDSPGHDGWSHFGQVAANAAPRNGSEKSVTFEDMNCDNYDDLFVHDADGSLRVWLNVFGQRDWDGLGKLAPGTGHDHVEFARLDNDGRADWAGVEPDGAVLAWMNRGGDR